MPVFGKDVKITLGKIGSDLPAAKTLPGNLICALAANTLFANNRSFRRESIDALITATRTMMKKGWLHTAAIVQDKSG